MNPLDALSALQSSMAALPASGAVPMPAQPPISEGFHFPDPAQVSIQPAAMPTPAATAQVAPTSATEGPGTWGHMVQQMVMDVNSRQQTAAQKVTDVLQGGPTPVHDAVVASEEASLSFAFLSEMRNKVVEAYQQVMQMQV